MSWGYFWGIHRRMWKDSSDTVGKIASVPGTGRYMRIKRGKLRLFEKYEYAKENLIQLLHYGLKMTEIIEICGSTAA